MVAAKLKQGDEVAASGYLTKYVRTQVLASGYKIK